MTESPLRRMTEELHVNPPLRRMTEVEKTISSIAAALEDVKVNERQCRLLYKRCKAVQEWFKLVQAGVPIKIRQSLNGMEELVKVLKRGMVLVAQSRSEKLQLWDKAAMFRDIFEGITVCMNLARDEILTNWILYNDYNDAVIRALDAAATENISRDEILKAVKEDRSRSLLCADLSGRIDREGAFDVRYLDVSRGEELLGSGTFSNVYKGKWFETEVAVKEFNSLGDTSHEKELLVMERVGRDHQNLLQIFGPFRREQKICLVMELMSSDLSKLITEKIGKTVGSESPFNFLTAVEIMLQIAKAISFLHERKIVHRDLKPANILVSYMAGEDCPVVKVGDFGTSKTDFKLNAQMTFAGSIKYMAPEILMNDNEEKLSYTEKVDVYSFGIICGEILTGIGPMNRKKPDLPSTCPVKLENLIRKCWSDEPDERPDFSSICLNLQNIKKDAIVFNIQNIKEDAIVFNIQNITEGAIVFDEEEIAGVIMVKLFFTLGFLYMLNLFSVVDLVALMIFLL